MASTPRCLMRGFPHFLSIYPRRRLLFQQINTDMILTENFTAKISLLQQLDEENFEKAVVFALNSLEGESKVYLHDVLLMDEDKATEILDTLLKFILYSSKFRSSHGEIDIWLESTPLSESKAKIFKEKLFLYLDKVRNKLHVPLKSSKENELRDINWRFQVTLSSKTSPSEFKPQVVLDFITSKTPAHTFLSCDFSNLRNLYQELNAAYKQHDSSSNKKVRNSIV